MQTPSWILHHSAGLRERPYVKHAIAGYLRLPQPTAAPALMRELH